MKRFAVTAALAVSAVLVIAQPASASWLQQSTPAVSGCVGVGLHRGVLYIHDFLHGRGERHGLLAGSLSGSTWTIVSIPDPGAGQLTGISCKTA